VWRLAPPSSLPLPQLAHAGRIGGLKLSRAPAELELARAGGAAELEFAALSSSLLPPSPSPPSSPMVVAMAEEEDSR